MSPAELRARLEPWRASVLRQVDGKPTVGDVLDAWEFESRVLL